MPLELSIQRGCPARDSSDRKVFLDEKIKVKVISQQVHQLIRLRAILVAQNEQNENEQEMTLVEQTLLSENAEVLQDSEKLMWIMDLHLKRPRTKVRYTAVEISAVGRRSEEQRSREDTPVEILEEFAQVEIPVSLLSSAIEGIEIGEPISVPPKSSPQNELNTAQETGFNEDDKVCLKLALEPLADLSLRSVRPVLEKDRLIAQLDILPSVAKPQIESQDLLVTQLKIHLENGEVTPMHETTLPLRINSGEGYSCCYTLQTVSQLASVVALATITLASFVGGDQGPLVETNWVTSVDFQNVPGPIPKTPNLGIGMGMTPGPHYGSSASLSSMATVQSNANRPSLIGVTMFLTGPTSVSFGTEFEWKVLVINKSSRSRKLAIHFPPLEGLNLITRHEDRALIQDESTLERRMQNVHESPGIMPMGYELRIGTLSSQSCFESRLRLLALRRGIHRIESSTVVDHASGDCYNTGELLEVVVV